MERIELLNTAAEELGFANFADAVKSGVPKGELLGLLADDTPEAEAPTTWESEVKALFNGKRKSGKNEGVPYMRPGTMRLVDGSDADSGAVVGVDGLDPTHARIARYGRTSDGDLFRFRQQVVWTPEFAANVADTVAEIVADGTVTPDTSDTSDTSNAADNEPAIAGTEVAPTIDRLEADGDANGLRELADDLGLDIRYAGNKGAERLAADIRKACMSA